MDAIQAPWELAGWHINNQEMRIRSGCWCCCRELEAPQVATAGMDLAAKTCILRYGEGEGSFPEGNLSRCQNQLSN